MNEIALWILVGSFALIGYGLCLMAVWTWRGIVSVVRA